MIAKTLEMGAAMDGAAVRAGKGKGQGRKDAFFDSREMHVVWHCV